MNVINYILSNSLDKLASEFDINISDYEDRIVLNYDQIKSLRFHGICDECRSLILSKKDYRVMARSFDRFYNVGEGTQWKTFPLNNCVIEEKIDGSLISCYWDFLNSKWEFATRKMAYAEGLTPIGVTFKHKILEAFYKTSINDYLNCDKCKKEYTWIFELTSPETRVVTPYKETELILTGARNNVSGHEFNRDQLDHAAEQMNVKRPKYFKLKNKNFDDIIKAAKELDAMQEGFVLVYDNPANSSCWRLKCKNEKYLAISHLRNNGGITPHRITKLIVENDYHEYLSYFPEDEKYFSICLYEYNNLIKEITETYNDLKGCSTQKDFALSVTKKVANKLKCSILFSMRKGEDLNVIINRLDSRKLAECLGLTNKIKESIYDC